MIRSTSSVLVVVTAYCTLFEFIIFIKYHNKGLVLFVFIHNSRLVSFIVKSMLAAGAVYNNDQDNGLQLHK